MGSVSRVGSVSHVEPFGYVASSGHVGLFGCVKLCDCVSTLRSFGRVGPFSSVELCGCVSTSRLFGRVGLFGHVGQSDRVEPSSLVGLFGSVPMLKGWFGCLASCVGNSLSRLHGRFPVLIGTLKGVTDTLFCSFGAMKVALAFSQTLGVHQLPSPQMSEF